MLPQFLQIQIGQILHYLSVLLEWTTYPTRALLEHKFMVSVGPEDNLNLLMNSDPHLKFLKNFSSREVWFSHWGGRRTAFTGKEDFAVIFGLKLSATLGSQICCHPKSWDPSISCLSCFSLRDLAGLWFKWFYNTITYMIKLWIWPRATSTLQLQMVRGIPLETT